TLPGRKAPHPAHIRQIRAGDQFEGRKRRFLTYSSSPRSPDPRHLAVLTRPGFVRAASRPPRHRPGQAALSFNDPLRQAEGAGPPPPHETTAPHGALTQLVTRAWIIKQCSFNAFPGKTVHGAIRAELRQP